ncbi:C-C motif chemokine 5-like [Nothobranchius furzeri]|uniref:C-C motif chemokine 5-like n=1 Tax=Nothobranchius furzeri TaxID=105023 RepID=UPI00240440D5|nr:C-C motif chemokine 22-like [Nothobranchius furzeri]
MMMTMKNPVILATCVLIFSSLTILAHESEFAADVCCFHFYSKPLKEANVKSIRWTDNLCPKQGVLFSMKAGRDSCVDPSQRWVKEIMEVKENIQAVTASH